MANLGKIRLDEQSNITFGLGVFGTSEPVKNARFIIESKDFDISLKCEIANDELKIVVPKLKGVLESGQHKVRLEVVVGDKIFTPLNETIEVDPLVALNVSKKKVKPIKENVVISIKAKDVLVEQAIDDGFEVVEMSGFKVIKTTDGKYAGLVSETRIIKASQPHDTLNSLVEELSQ